MHTLASCLLLPKSVLKIAWSLLLNAWRPWLPFYLYVIWCPVHLCNVFFETSFIVVNEIFTHPVVLIGAQ
jgi:hypothetical protein